MDRISFLGEIEKRESLEHFVSSDSKKTIRTVKDIDRYYAVNAGEDNAQYKLLLEQLMRDCVDGLTEKRRVDFETEQKGKIAKLNADERNKLKELLDNGEFSSARDYVDMMVEPLGTDSSKRFTDFSKRFTFDNLVFSEFWKHCDEYAKAGEGKAGYLNGLKEIIERIYKKSLTEATYQRAREISALWPKTDANQNSSQSVFALLSKLNGRFIRTRTIPLTQGERKFDKENGLTVQRMNLPVQMKKESNGDYSGRAPIPEFGFYMKSLDVALILTSRDTVKVESIAKTIASLCGSIMKTDTPLLVLLNRALSRKEWQTLSVVLKTLRDRQTVLVLDWSIMLYAVLTNPENEVDAWNRIMRCAIPLHGLNPFPESSARIPSELFAGRKKTISDFLNHTTPAHFLYGGRQLGKTAIFNFVNDISDDDVVVQKVILGKSGNQVLELIGEELCNKIDSFKNPNTWEELFRGIRQATNRLKNEGKKLVLFVDEADAFLDRLRRDFAKHYDANSDPIQQLWLIEDDTNQNFHFAFAGKHNVYRFYNWCCNEADINIDWCKKTKIVPINPFSYSEAEELLSKLSYFNIRFKDNDKAKRRIFNEANYYPGLIHLFCHEAVERVNEAFQKLSPNDCVLVADIGLLDDSDIEAIIRSTAFRKSQRNLFDITIKLTDAEEEAYLCIAYALAYLSLETGKSAFTANDVAVKACKNFRKLDKSAIPKYLEELCELSILERIGEGDNAQYYQYSFKRDRYRDYLRPDGSADDDEITYKFWELEAKH